MTDERRWHVYQRAYDRALAQFTEADWAAAWFAWCAPTPAQAVAETLGDADKMRH